MFSDSATASKQEQEDEDCTLISEDTLPYLSEGVGESGSSILERATSAGSTTYSVRSYSTQQPLTRPQTAPSLEGHNVGIDSTTSPSPDPFESDSSTLSIRRKVLTPKPHARDPPSSRSARRLVSQSVGQNFRGRIELDYTETGSRLPLKPPVARTVAIKSRPRSMGSSRARSRPPVQEAFPVAEPSTLDSDDHATENKEGDDVVPQTTTAPPIEPTSRQFVYDDPDNRQYSAMKKNARESMSEADKSALRLGRMMLSTVLNQPEISIPDAISRFFMDTWLAKNGSSISKADGLSVSLMTNLQRAFTEYDPGVDVGATKAATCQKTVAAIACETLDTLIQAFGESNPVLFDIRESLLPLIFMHPPEFEHATAKKFTDQSLCDDTKLRGERYIDIDTWCEDGAVIVEELRNTESKLFDECQKSHQAEEALSEMSEQFKKLEHESAGAIKAMNHARADFKKSEANYHKLKSSFNEISISLKEERQKFSDAKARFDRVNKANVVGIVNMTSLKAKYEAVVAEKQELTENKMRLKHDIELLNKNLASSHQSFEAARKSLAAVKANAKESDSKIASLEAEIASRNAKENAAVNKMKDFFQSKSNTNKVMSRRVYDMLASKTDALSVLVSWKDDLLMALENSELKLKGMAEELKKSDDENMKMVQKQHMKEIKELNSASVKQILDIKKRQQEDMEELKESLVEHRKDNLDLTLERNSIEAELQQALESQSAREAVFTKENEDMILKMQELTACNNTMHEQLCAIREDRMLEEVLHHTKLAQTDLVEKVSSLADSMENVKRDLEREIVKSNEQKAEMDTLGAELLDANNLVAEKEDVIVGLEEQIEVLSKPNAKEIKLIEEIASLKVDIVKYEENISELTSMLETSEREKQRWQKEYDNSNLMHEDWLTAQRIRNVEFAADMNMQISTLQTTICTQTVELNKSYHRAETSENQLAQSEDSSVRKFKITEELLAEKLRLEGDIENFTADNALLTKKICEQDEKSKLLALELEDVVRRNESLLEQKNEATESFAMLSSESESLMIQRLQGRKSSRDAATVLVPLHSIVCTDDKCIQTDKVVVSNSKSESKVISSGNQSTGRGIPTRQTDQKSVRRSNSPVRTQESQNYVAGRGNRKVVTRSLTTQAPASANGNKPANYRRSESSSSHSRSRAPSTDDTSINSNHSISNSVKSHKSNTSAVSQRTATSARAKSSRGRPGATVSPSRTKQASTSPVTSPSTVPVTLSSPIFSPAKKQLVGPNTYAPSKRASTDSLMSTTSHLSDTSAVSVNVTIPNVAQTLSTNSSVMLDEDLSDDDCDEIAVPTKNLVAGQSPLRNRVVSIVDDDVTLNSGHSGLSRNSDKSVKKIKVIDHHGSMDDSLFTEPEQIHEPEQEQEMEQEMDLDKQDLNEYDYDLDEEYKSGEEGRIILSQDEVAENLGELDNNFSKLFDMSVAFESSQNFLFDIIALREKRNFKRLSRYKVLTREAKALVSRLEGKISLLSRSLLKANNRVVEQDDLLQSMRAEITDNRWIFELKSTDFLQQCPLKDAIVVGGLLLQAAEVGDDLEVIQTCDTVVQDKGCGYGIKKLAAGMQEWKDKYDERIHLLSDGRPYDTMIRREDGTIDTDLDLDLYKDPTDRSMLLMKMNEQLRQDKSDMQKILSEELQFLRNMLKSKDRDLDTAMSDIKKLKTDIDALRTTTAPLMSYTKVRGGLCDAIQFMLSLSMSNHSDLGPESLPPGGHVSKLKSKVLQAENSNISVYGNPGLLWRKIQKKKRFDKAALIKQGHRNAVPELTLVPHEQLPEQVPPRSAPSSDEMLLSELSRVCEDLAEKVLFPSEPSMYTNSHQKSSFILQSPEGMDDSFELYNESMVSNVEISPSLLEFSVNLNKNVNHHVEKIRHLKQKRSELLGESSNTNPSVQAERYYAAQNIFTNRNPDNISKWSQSFLEGSGSDAAQSIVRKGGPSGVLPLRQEVRYPPPMTDDDSPVIERRQLSTSEAARPASVPNKQFLASYRNTVKESDIPLLTKIKMK